MRNADYTHHTRLLRAAFATVATVLLFLTVAGVFFPVVGLSAKEDIGLPAPVGSLTPDRSGTVVVPAGDASLPVALTGVNACGAVLIEAVSGEVIFGQNENARLPMASTTKIMTALVALEALPLDTPVKITAESVGVEGSSIYLVEGEVLTLEQLLYALLLESANDAASAIAVAVSGSVEGFAEHMNRKAAELELTNTHFVNPHGLDAEGHYTTAYELAVITRAALENEVFREICATERKTIPLHGTEGVRLLLNHNRLLNSYDGCIGVKTGFTKKTGRCLVSAAERDGVTLIAVTLNAPDDWRDHTAMLDYGFGLYETIPLCEAGFFSAPLWLISGTQEYVMVENTDALAVTLRRDHGRIRCVVELPRFDFAPIGAGQTVGQLRFFEEARDGTERELGAVPLKTTYGVDAVTYPQSFWERLFALFQK
jgi:D-alanyl-D-alanine carboxypeptidase